MKTLKCAAATISKGFPMVADDIIELHASRLLLLLKYCGTEGKIEGFSKLAKLDYFIRFPEVFDTIVFYFGNNTQSAAETIQSAMMRHHYGPWDKRYNHVLPYLKTRNLIEIIKENAIYCFGLTPMGWKCANKLSKTPEFADEIKQMNYVKSLVRARQHPIEN